VQIKQMMQVIALTFSIEEFMVKKNFIDGELVWKELKYLPSFKLLSLERSGRRFGSSLDKGFKLYPMVIA